MHEASDVHVIICLSVATIADNIVLVSETNADIDTNGTLHALNATDGTLLWSLEALDAENIYSFGLYYVPAIDETYYDILNLCTFTFDSTEPWQL